MGSVRDGGVLVAVAATHAAAATAPIDPLFNSSTASVTTSASARSSCSSSCSSLRILMGLTWCVCAVLRMGGGGSGGGGGGLHSPGITSFATGTVSFGGSSTAVVPASVDSCGLGPLLCLPWQSTGVSMGGGTHPLLSQPLPLLARASPSRYPHLLSILLVVLVRWLGHLVGPG